MSPRRLAVHVVLLAAVALTLLPYVYLVTGTVKSPGEIFRLPLQLLPHATTTEHYRDLFASDLIPFARQMGNSVVIATLTTVLVVTVSASVGWGFAKYDFPLRNALFVVLLATLTLPLQVALVPLFSMMVSLNWLDTFQGVVLPSGASAFGAFFIRQAMLAVPDEMVQAARIDGASEFRIFLTMGVPLAKGALSVLRRTDVPGLLERLPVALDRAAQPRAPDLSGRARQPDRVLQHGVRHDPRRLVPRHAADHRGVRRRP